MPGHACALVEGRQCVLGALVSTGAAKAKAKLTAHVWIESLLLVLNHDF